MIGIDDNAACCAQCGRTIAGTPFDLNAGTLAAWHRLGCEDCWRSMVDAGQRQRDAEARWLRSRGPALLGEVRRLLHEHGEFMEGTDTYPDYLLDAVQRLEAVLADGPEPAMSQGLPQEGRAA